MPTLTIRTVGMSLLIEGFDPSAIDVESLVADLEAVHGIALARLKVPKNDAPDLDPGDSAIEAVLIDRKATSSDNLKRWLEDWVIARGATYTAWASNALGTEAVATLHFHT